MLSTSSFRMFVVAVCTLTTLSMSHLAAADLFDQLDGNEDGVLSGREARPLIMLDADGDGEITRQEFEAVLRRHAAESIDYFRHLFITQDANEDGRLSGTELSGFEFTDMDGDGRVSQPEFLAGMKAQFAKLATRAVEEIQEIAQQRFLSLDGNEDGRLSGSELEGMHAYDLNDDKRVTAEEFATGFLMQVAAASANELDDTPPIDEEGGVLGLYGKMIAAVNSGNTRPLLNAFHPELQKLVDEPVLGYVLSYIGKHHGKLILPAAEDVEISAGNDGDGQEIAEARIPCAEGELTLHLTALEGTLVAFNFDTAILTTLNRDLGRDLINDEALAKKFMKFYSPTCKKVLEATIAGDDDAFIAMIHPDVVKQIGRDNFLNVARYISAGVGKLVQFEEESIRADLDDSQDLKFLTLTHHAGGTDGTVALDCKFQLLGLKAAIVGISARKVGGPAPAPEKPDMPVADQRFKETHATEYGVKFRMPGTPKRIVDDEGVVSWLLEDDATAANYLVQILTFEVNFEGESETYFEALKASLPESLNGELVDDDLDKVEGHPSQVLMMNLKNGAVLVRRDILIENRGYVLQWVSTDKSKKAQQENALPFIESFKLSAASDVKVDEDDDAPPPPAPPAP
ncbi:MAG TPA: hypothetical protein VMM76_17010 [Pirellulaceae bacterium]|nr:hypothetical protein [Pirellulaceae bacterium]